jgi:hypothetical protein
MKITKQGTQYKITDKGTIHGKSLRITAYVSDKGVTLYNEREQLDFNFIESEQQLLRKLGKMITAVGSIKV